LILARQKFGYQINAPIVYPPIAHPSDRAATVKRHGTLNR
jgi:hypothetical protein